MERGEKRDVSPCAASPNMHESSHAGPRSDSLTGQISVVYSLVNYILGSMHVVNPATSCLFTVRLARGAPLLVRNLIQCFLQLSWEPYQVYESSQPRLTFGSRIISHDLLKVHSLEMRKSFIHDDLGQAQLISAFTRSNVLTYHRSLEKTVISTSDV